MMRLLPAAVPRLETARLVLRALEPRDAEALFAIFADAEAMRYWSGPPWTDMAEARAMIERERDGVATRTSLRWGIATRDRDVVIGTPTLFSFHAQCRRAEIGYILNREHWGRGVMNEALGAVIDWAFGTLRLHRIEADIDPRNARSVRALERLGFVREGLLRERWRVGDEVSDSVMMGLLEREWGRVDRAIPAQPPRP